MPDIDPNIPPSGEGCAECLATDDGWWVHLRRCAACGHVGCCDTSPSQHATRHWQATGHPVIRSFEPGEDWFWDYRVEQAMDGPDLAPPECRPESQDPPSPADRVPRNWQSYLH